MTDSTIAPRPKKQRFLYERFIWLLNMRKDAMKKCLHIVRETSSYLLRVCCFVRVTAVERPEC